MRGVELVVVVIVIINIHPRDHPHLPRAAIFEEVSSEGMILGVWDLTLGGINPALQRRWASSPVDGGGGLGAVAAKAATNDDDDEAGCQGNGGGERDKERGGVHRAIGRGNGGPTTRALFVGVVKENMELNEKTTAHLEFPQ